MSVPYLKNGCLMVHETPYLMLCGEVHNSSSSSLEYMEKVWDQAGRLGMNSLLLPVTWEMTEPEEGVFDFGLVDGLIAQARRRGKRLGLLWFGAWKNAQCYYAPGWVKENPQRFHRAEMEKGKPFIRLKEFYGMGYSSLSYLCRETLEADKKAIVALMKHLKAVDGEENTVILVQVENETGVMGAAREHSDLADAVFDAPVPRDFADYMRDHADTMASDIRADLEKGSHRGSWAEIFGDCADEIFSTYHIASYVGELAAAGKEVYPLPMSVNCWLDQGGGPGVYPSGGPVLRVHEVWRFCAPEIDIYSPDIYVPYFLDVCDEYVRSGNPLFIPECATHSYAGPRLVYCIGYYHAGCYSPFGFEEMGQPFSAQAGFLFGMDVEDPALKTPQNPEEYGWYGRTLENMMPLLTSRYGTDRLQAVCAERKSNLTMNFESFSFTAHMDGPMISRRDGVCLICQIAGDEFYVIANGCMLSYTSLQPQKSYVDVLLMEEGRFENGRWIPDRRLNGDEIAVSCYHEPVLLRLKLLAY